MKKLNETGDWNDDIAAEMKKAVGEFAATGSF